MIVAAILPLAQFRLISPLASVIPVWDQWSEVEALRAHFEHHPVLHALLKPYNGHFNVVPRVILYGLALLTHWNLNAEIAASYIVCVATLVVLLSMLREADPNLMILAAPVSAMTF